MKLKLIGLFALATVLPSNALAFENSQNCSEIKDDAQRLACYDDAAKPSPEADEKEKSNWFGFMRSQKSNKVEDFGNRKPAKEELNQIVSSIKAISYRKKTAHRITLENGQVWEQLSSDLNYVTFKEGRKYKATIKKAALGSFKMTISPIKKTIRVKRIE